MFAGGGMENNLCVSAKRCRNRREVEVCGAEEGSEGLKSGDTGRDDQSWRSRRRGGTVCSALTFLIITLSD